MAELTATARGFSTPELAEGSKLLARFGTKGVDPNLAAQFLAWAQRTGHTLSTRGDELWAIPISAPPGGKPDDYFEQYKLPIIAAIAVVFIVLLMRA